MNKIKKLQLQILDKYIIGINFFDVPKGGWISSVRNSLGMSLEQLSKKLGISKQSVFRLEKNEINDSITLKSLRKTAEALDCKLFYAFVPNEGTLQGIIKKQAEIKARELVDSVDHTMKLEDQAASNYHEKLKEITEELAKNSNSKLWD